jgi:hypothetical protein
VTRHLPHAQLPIGRYGTTFHLKTCIDSCAGINLGDYHFHMALAKLYPESVAEITDLTSTGRQIQIGGVDVQGGGLKVTHVISYWMPYSKDGTQARVAFGLSDHVAATALVGIGFLRATKAISHFAGDEPYLQLPAIDLSLDVTYEAASVRTPPVRRDSSNVYQATYGPADDGNYDGNEGDSGVASVSDNQIE